MGLLSRLRSSPSADTSPTPADELPVVDLEEPPEPVAAPEAGSDPDDGVFRASSLNPVPEWEKVPPIPPLLPEMPFVVSQHFDDSLTSWQPPQQFIQSLGHSVSESAPSGVVDGFAVLTPFVPSEAPDLSNQATAVEPLPLAVPPEASFDDEDDDDFGPRWRTEAFEDQYGDFEPDTGERVPQTEPEVALPLAGVDPSAGAVEPSPSSVADPGGLVGSRPLATSVQRLVSVDSPNPQSPLIHATTPPELPLASLPSELMPSAPQPEPPATASEAVAATTTELTGDRPLVGTTSTEVAKSETPSDVDPGALTSPPPDLPLAVAPADDGFEDARPSTEWGAGFDEVAVADQPRANAEPEALEALEAPSSTGAPDAAAADEGPIDASTETSPLVGDRPLIDVSTAADVPITGLPPGPGPGEGSVDELPLVSPSLSAADEDAGMTFPAAVSASEYSGSSDDSRSGDVSGPAAPSLQRAVEEVAGEDDESRADSPGDGTVEDSTGAGAAPETAPLVGFGTPLGAASTPLGSTGDLISESGDGEPTPLDQPLAVPALPAAQRLTDPAELDTSGEPPPFDQPLAIPPAARRRSGLGEPMSKLPPSAASWDITTLTPAQQAQATRALIQGFADSASRNVRPGQVPVSRMAEPSSPPTIGSFPLAVQRAVIDSVGAAPMGVMPDDLAPLGGEQAPLVSMDPLYPPSDPTDSEPAGTGEGTHVRELVGGLHGVDLSSVPVDRSARGAAEVQRMGARAFTSDLGVVIPSQVGTLNAGPGAELLAHELTHVAQRARLGPSVPSELSYEGEALEAEAQATELTLRTGTSTSASEGSHDEHGSNRVSVQTLPLASATPAAPDTDALAASIMAKISAMGLPGREDPRTGTTEVFSSAWSAPPTSTAGATVQRATDNTFTVESSSDPALAAEGGGSGGAARPSDEDLSNLSRWLYPLIRYRLKGELREDRERSGLLTDVYKRW